MIKDVQDWEVLGILLGIRDPDTKFDKIKQINKDPEKQKVAMIHHWHTTHPLASWSLLHQALNMKGDIQTAKAVQEKFLKGVKNIYKHLKNLTNPAMMETFPQGAEIWGG